jgi:hypothetical protein
MEDTGLFWVCPFGGNRIPYVVDEIFRRRLGLSVTILKPVEFSTGMGFGIGYGVDTGHLAFPSSGILEESGSTRFKATLDLDFKKSSLRSPDGKETSGDLPGLVFWLLSRYEEYAQPDLMDLHGRFPTHENTLVKSGLQSIPLIELG